MKVEAAEYSACFAELSPAMPTSHELQMTPMTDPPQPHRLNSSPCNTEQYTHIQVDQVNAVIIFYSLISQLAGKYSIHPSILGIFW
jgi:hypothetical protein